MMISILDLKFNVVTIVENYTSFIWNDYYEDLGDFEIVIPAGDKATLSNIHNDYYVKCSESDRTMIIEKIEYKTDLDNGNTVIISGHSIETILNRRIIWKDDGSITEINKDVINDRYDAGLIDESVPIFLAIQYLLDDNIIEPSNSLRKIDQFYSRLTVDASIDEPMSLVTPSCAYQGDLLYDVIRAICQSFDISFKMVLNTEDSSSDDYNKFKIIFYKGVNHLSSQQKNGYVCFSKEYDNLLNSDSYVDMSTYKTMAYYKGQASEWVVKEFNKDEPVAVGYIRIHNNAAYASKVTYADVPHAWNAAEWDLCEEWTLARSYAAGEYVTHNKISDTSYNAYRCTNAVINYNSGTSYSKNNAVRYNNWMYISLVDNNNHSPAGLAHGKQNNYWYSCADTHECFNAQSWEAVGDIEKSDYYIYGDIQNGSSSGIDRRELYVDATSVPSSYEYNVKTDGGEELETKRTWIIDEATYKATLNDMTLSELTAPSNRMTKEFSAEVETKLSFIYGKDYNLGDIIEVKDDYGYVDSVVVKSFIISVNESGEQAAYPTFESVEASTIVTKYLLVDEALSTGTFLVKIPESTEFNGKQIIATSEYNGTTYYLMSYRKNVTSDATFATGRSTRILDVVAWCRDTTVYTDGRYQSSKDLFNAGPNVIGTPLFYRDREIVSGETYDNVGIVNPNWLPPEDVNLGVVKTINESASQYRNILLANI